MHMPKRYIPATGQALTQPPHSPLGPSLTHPSVQLPRSPATPLPYLAPQRTGGQGNVSPAVACYTALVWTAQDKTWP